MKYIHDLTISIVSYNTHKELKKCIESLYKYTHGISFELIVIDNASIDGTFDMLKELQKKYQKSHKKSHDGSQTDFRIFKKEKNMYFAPAHNYAFTFAKGRYFLILNADTYFADNALQKMAEYLDVNPEVGAVEGVEMYPDGALQNTGSQDTSPLLDFYELSSIGKRIAKAFAKGDGTHPRIEQYRMTTFDRRKTYEVDVACDAFLMIRSEIFNKVGGYDSHLKLYYTENDLCRKVRNEGSTVVHYGDSTVIHHVSLSANQLKWKKLDLYYSDLFWYHRKYSGIIPAVSLWLILHLERVALKIFRPKMFNEGN